MGCSTLFWSVWFPTCKILPLQDRLRKPQVRISRPCKIPGLPHRSQKSLDQVRGDQCACHQTRLSFLRGGRSRVFLMKYFWKWGLLGWALVRWGASVKQCTDWTLHVHVQTIWNVKWSIPSTLAPEAGTGLVSENTCMCPQVVSCLVSHVFPALGVQHSTGPRAPGYTCIKDLKGCRDRATWGALRRSAHWSGVYILTIHVLHITGCCYASSCLYEDVF